jgi:AcrR family transcriptional regulator
MRQARREVLLDAAGDLMRTRGWGKTHMIDVAAYAGVSRTTLYSEFQSRNAIALAALLREVGRVLVPFQEGFARHPEDAQVALAVAFDDFLYAIASNPLAQALVLNAHNEEILELLTIKGTPTLDLIRNSLTGFICETWPQCDPLAADLLADSIGRLGISVATLPGRDPYLTGQRLAELLGPFARTATGTPVTSDIGRTRVG